MPYWQQILLGVVRQLAEHHWCQHWDHHRRVKQGLPIVLIPLWQWIHGTPRAERWAFASALLLYVIAKIAELYDHEIASALGEITGHTLKHLLATGATYLVVACLIRRVRTQKNAKHLISNTATSAV